MPFALFGILVYPIGIPAFVYISLRLNVPYLHHDVKGIESELEDALAREDLLIELIENVDGQPDDKIVLACLKASGHVQTLDAELEQVTRSCSWLDKFAIVEKMVQVRSRLLEHQIVRVRYGFMYLQYAVPPVSTSNVHVLTLLFCAESRVVLGASYHAAQILPDIRSLVRQAWVSSH